MEKPKRQWYPQEILGTIEPSALVRRVSLEPDVRVKTGLIVGVLREIALDDVTIMTLETIGAGGLPAARLTGDTVRVVTETVATMSDEEDPNL